MFTTLITTEELAANLQDPEWVIVDCRFDLMDKEWGEEEYAQFHIPGAVFAHQERDLCSPVTPTTGRHPLPDPDTFVATLRRLGINNSNQVVVYDTTGGGMAARLWFLLKYYGHDAVALLDGGLPAWVSENRSTMEGVETRQPGKFTGTPRAKMVVTTDEVKNIVKEKGRALIDSRSPERFRGEVEPIDTVAGRIPGALNRFYGDNLDHNGYFKPPQTLNEAFKQVLGSIKPEHAVVYCGSGTTACHNLVAMAHAGLPMAKIYIGSWSEWIRDPENPIGKG